MRGGDATVFWLRAGASEQLPISLAAWRESFRAREAAEADAGGAAAETPAASEPGAPAAVSEPEAPAEP
jgi:hypothetical protein